MLFDVRPKQEASPESMTNIQAYWFIICVFALMFARYSSIGNSARDWVRILLGELTVSEAIAADKARGVDGALYHHMGIVNENQRIRDALLPPLFHFKNGFAVFGGILFIVSGFFWTRWYWPIVALPAYMLILPRIFMPLVRGRSHGYKERLLKGLEIKIEVAKRFDTPREVELYTDLRQELQKTLWRP
jgi:hypothetical protein